ncbi:phage tail protein [Shewanella morhuae]|uniref:Phage Tail Collar Domain n=1 Tax=Shewanella morhuae TaxID=365591 RepID=A0A380ATU1_9GAMM|nr:tail fiber protein [Shewanella morhuae]SUI87421.1 Phage Tail Collar Domain [Shewanella morhuae]
MSQPYLGEVRMFAITYAPRHWADCSGQIMAISQNQALFSLLGTTFGGNGSTTFALPDYRGRTPVGSGGSYVSGQSAGNEAVTLLQTQIPPHTHLFNAQNETGNSQSPSPTTGSNICAVPDAGSYYVAPNTNVVLLAADAIAAMGSSAAHSNLQPSLVLRFAIALQGIFPSRN